MFERFELWAENKIPVSTERTALDLFSSVRTFVGEDKPMIDEAVIKIRESEATGNIKAVQDEYVALIRLFRKSAKDMFQGEKDIFILEYRLLKQISGVISYLRALKQPEINDIINKLRSLMDTLKSKITKERRIAVDLFRNRKMWREIRLMPEKMMEDSLLNYARAERRIIEPINKLVEEIKDITEKLTSGKIKPEELNQWKNRLMEELKVIAPLWGKEIELVIGEEDKMLILTHRLRIKNIELFDQLQGLVKEGFPKNIEDKLFEENKQFIQQLEEEADITRKYSLAIRKVAA